MIAQEEDFEACIPELKPMMAELEDDVQFTCPLQVDWSLYIAISNAGAVKLLTCRDDGVLLGFCVIMLSPNLHSIGNVIAMSTGIFCPKAYRGKGVGLKLIALAEEKQKQYNWHELMIASRAVKPLDKILTRRGYVAQETFYSRKNDATSTTIR